MAQYEEELSSYYYSLFEKRKDFSQINSTAVFYTKVTIGFAGSEWLFLKCFIDKVKNIADYHIRGHCCHLTDTVVGYFGYFGVN